MSWDAGKVPLDEVPDMVQPPKGASVDEYLEVWRVWPLNFQSLLICFLLFNDTSHKGKKVESKQTEIQKVSQGGLMLSR